MALTDAERAKIRLYLGWSSRFFASDSALEQALNAIDGLPEALALIQNAIDGSPPGLLAALEDVDAKLVASHSRLKASVVGSITLNQGELAELRREGKRLTSRLATLLGVEVVRDVWSGRLPRVRSTHAGNYRPQG